MKPGASGSDREYAWQRLAAENTSAARGTRWFISGSSRFAPPVRLSKALPLWSVVASAKPSAFGLSMVRTRPNISWSPPLNIAIIRNATVRQSLPRSWSHRALSFLSTHDVPDWAHSFDQPGLQPSCSVNRQPVPFRRGRCCNQDLDLFS